MIHKWLKKKTQDSHWSEALPEMDKETLKALTRGDMSKLVTTKYEMNFVIFVPTNNVQKITKVLQDNDYARISKGGEEEGYTALEIMLNHFSITEESYRSTIATLTDIAEEHGGIYDGWFACEEG